MDTLTRARHEHGEHCADELRRAIDGDIRAWWLLRRVARRGGYMSLADATSGMLRELFRLRRIGRR